MSPQELRIILSKQVEIGDEAWNEFLKIIKPRQVRKKEHFLRQGEVCQQLGFVAKGYMRLYFLKEEEEITKDFSFENTFCGSYASFSLQQPSRFNIIAMEDCELFTFGREALYTLFDKFPEIQKFGRLNIEKLFIRKELREASFLLDNAETRYENLLRDFPGITQRVPLRYLASYLGMKAETLSRIRAK